MARSDEASLATNLNFRPLLSMKRLASAFSPAGCASSGESASATACICFLDLQAILMVASAFGDVRFTAFVNPVGTGCALAVIRRVLVN